MTDLENREAFEETLSRIGKTDESTFDKHDDGSYKMDIIHFGWKIWQASAQRQGFKLVPLEPTKEMIKQAEKLYIVEGVDIFSAVVDAV